MCGIAGKIYFNNKINQKKEIGLINKVINLLDHRGPDSYGYSLKSHSWLLSCRLAIIDTNPRANQPMLSDDGKVSIVFNGEIYNYPEIKKNLLKKSFFKTTSDTEVVLKLYQEKGPECLSYLRGMFAFAIWDENLGRLFIARDRIGKKPLKYYFNSTCFIFASELKALFVHSEVNKEPDWKAIGQFMKDGYVISPGTGFKNIYKLEPASYMLIDKYGRIEKKKYWWLNFKINDSLSLIEWQYKLDKELTECVNLRLRSDVPVGIHLSGGIDSSLITAIACQISPTRLKTFTVGFDDEKYSEFLYAGKVASIYNTQHYKITVKPELEKDFHTMIYHYEEPFSDPSMFPTWYLMKATKGKVKVVLNGDGGDENFAGYPRYLLIRYAGVFRNFPLNKSLGTILKKIYSICQVKDIDRLGTYFSSLNLSDEELYEEIAAFIKKKERNILLSDKINEPKKLGTENRKVKSIYEFIAKDISYYLPDDLLAKTDLAAMANSLEARSPFLDHKFMELTSSIPINLKIKGLTNKYILKRIAAKYLPRDIIYRRKQGFLPPLHKWIKGNLFYYIKSELNSKSFDNLNLIDMTALNLYLDEHKNGYADHSYLIWSMFCLRIWFKVWYNT